MCIRSVCPTAGEGALLLMPAWIDRELIGVKTVTYFPSNAGTAAPTVNAAYLLLDGRSRAAERGARRR